MDTGNDLHGVNKIRSSERTARDVEDGAGPDSRRTTRSKLEDILGGLSFLNSSRDMAKQEREDENTTEEAKGSKTVSSIATALRQSQGRQRKGSLRQAAMAKMRERSGSFRKERAPAKLPSITTTKSADSSDVSFDPSPVAILEPPQLLASPAISPAGSYISTTDEDDSMSFYRPAASALSRRRSNRSERRTSLTTTPTTSDADLDDEWDYSETEWWGWVVLIATWIVFVVGMGSCLGIWGWAWDVGETPYAPPDLEDDATLPITGYYPALMVCTAVMAWVWVVVAWVGMKYFRHAKVGVDG